MVVQPHPAGGKVARWHCVPGDAGLLPADVPPFSGDIIFNSLVAYPMGTGRTRMTPGKQAGKDGGKTEVEKRCGVLAFAALLAEILFYYFSMGMPGITMPKTGRTMSSPASPGAMRTMPLLSGTLVFSSLLLLFPCKWKMWLTKGETYILIYSGETYLLEAAHRVN